MEDRGGRVENGGVARRGLALREQAGEEKVYEASRRISALRKGKRRTKFGEQTRLSKTKERRERWRSTATRAELRRAAFQVRMGK